MPSALSELRPALDAATKLLEELVEAHAEVTFAEEGEYEDPGAFADAVLNNLAAVAYAVNAGLPVTAWSPVQKNSAEAERVLRAVRQWSEQARVVIEAYAAGQMTQDQLWAAMYDIYVRQSTNAFMAGRRSVGNMSPLSPQAQALLAQQQQPDLARLQAANAAGGTGGGALSTLVQSIFNPQNFIGSGLPGDPQALLFGSGHEAKLGATMAQRVEQYGKTIGSMASLGEMSGLEGIPDETVIVWWEMGDSDHCVDCIQLADLSPYLEKTLLQNGVFPGSGHTQCGSNCACALNYDIPSEVCGDTMSELLQTDITDDIGEADAPARPLPFMDSNDRTKFAVWVQEADSCAIPMSIGSFAGDAGAIDILDDAEAFSWDDDLAMAMEGDPDTAIALEEALATGKLNEGEWGWLRDYLGDDLGTEQVGELTMKAEKMTYRYAWRETGDHVIFDFGRTTSGLTTLDPELTMRALSQLGERAAAAGKALRINAETAGPGMRKWLDSLATDRIEGVVGPPKVIPKWDFIPGPALTPGSPTLAILPEVEALPKLPDVATLIESPVPLQGGTGVRMGFHDAAGTEWAVKGQLGITDEAATKIADDMGLRVVPTTAVGHASYQPILKDVKKLDDGWEGTTAQAFGLLTPEQAAEVVNQNALDFVVANRDNHIGQWLIDSKGRMWGIDKDQSFMAMAYSPSNHFFWAGDEQYGTLLAAAFANVADSAVLAKVAPEVVGAAIDRMEAYGAERLIATAGAALDVVPMGRDAAEAAIRSRVGALREAYTTAWRNAAEGADSVPANWRTWLDAGGTFTPGPALAPVVAEPAAAQALLKPFEPGYISASGAHVWELEPRLQKAYKAWADGLTDAERTAMLRYQADSGTVLASVLRKGQKTDLIDALAKDQGLQTVDEWMTNLDTALAKATLPEDVLGFGKTDLSTVFRGTTDTHGLPEIGAVYTDPGYMSTSISSESALHFATSTADASGATPVVYRIAMPKGEQGAFLDSFFHDDLSYEKEILLPRGQQWKVADVQRDVILRAGELDTTEVVGHLVDIVPSEVAVTGIIPTLPDPTRLGFVDVDAMQNLADSLDEAASLRHAALTLEQREALTMYATDAQHAADLNAGLRAGTGFEDATLDAALAAERADRPLIGYRGINKDAAVEPALGDIVQTPAYNSVTVDPMIAGAYASGEGPGGIVYRYPIPEGHPGSYLGSDVAGTYAYEREFLMPRDESWRVSRITKDVSIDGAEGPVTVVDLMPVPRVATVIPEPIALLPIPPKATPLPASMRATATDISYVGTNRATWATTFKPAGKYDDAVERIDDLIPGKNHLGEFTLPQLNAILARAEVLDGMGFDLARVTRLDDFSKVPEDVKHGRVGLTKGHTVAIRHDAKWQFFPEQAMHQHPAVYDDVGGAFAHEYGHVLLTDMGKDARATLKAIRADNPGVVLSDYAAENLDEWFGEVVSKISAPGYVTGTLPYDQQVYELLGRERLLKRAELATEPIGPPIPLDKPALGIRPGDAQQYLVGDNPLPVNAPLAEWSGIVPTEPALPAGLKPPKEEIAAAKAEADAAYMDWHDVALGKTEVSLSWGAKDREQAEAAGLIYREVKTKSGGSTRFIARDTEVANRTEAWLQVQGRSSQSDEFWLHVLGYKPEQLASIDTYEELRRGGKRLSAGVVMVEPDGKVWVLAPKNEFAGYQNTWVKGGVDDGETAAAAAVREVREETGFSVELDSYLGDYANTDKTGLTRMYVGHRTGGGPMDAHLKETYKMRLLDEGEAAKLLTRYGKPDARDQTILHDVMAAVKGEAPVTHYVIGADEVGTFTDMLKPKVYPKKLGEPKWDAHGRLEFAINPRPVMSPSPSTAFAYDKSYIDHMGANYVEYPASTKAFPYATSKWQLPDGQSQAMYWKVEPGAVKPAEATTDFATNRLFWANSKKQVADPHLRYNLHVAQLRTMLGKMEADATIGVLRVNEALLDQVPQLRELLVAAGAKKVGGFTELGAAEAHTLAESLANDVPLPKPTAAVPAAPLIPVPTPVTMAELPVATVAMLLDDAQVLNTGPVQVWHSISWPSPAGTAKTGWSHNPITGKLLFDATAVPSGSLPSLIAAHIALGVHIAETHPDAAITTIQLGSKLWVGKLKEVQPLLTALDAKLMATGRYEIDIERAKAFTAKLKADLGDIGSDPAILHTDWAPLAPVGTTVPTPAFIEAPVASYSAPTVAAGAQASVGAPAATSKVTAMLAGAVDQKVKLGVDSMTQTLYPAGGQATWRRLGNVLEVHSASLGKESGAAHLLRMAKVMDEAPKVSGLRFTTQAESALTDDTMALILGAGGKSYAGGVKLTREQVLAIRDQLLATSGATEAKAAAAGVVKALDIPKPGLDDAIERVKVTPAASKASIPASMDTVRGKIPYDGPPNSGAHLQQLPGTISLENFGWYGPDGKLVAAMHLTAEGNKGAAITVATAAGETHKGYATKLYDYVQDQTEYNLYPAVGNSTFTKEGRAFATSWLEHRSALTPGKAIPTPTAFVPTMGPKYGFAPKSVGLLSPTIIPQKQGFEKVAFSNMGMEIGTVRVRKLSKEIVFSGMSGDASNAHEVLTARLRMLRDEIKANPLIERIRFDPAGMGTLKIPSGTHAMLMDYGAEMVGDTLYLAREKAYKLSLDLEHEVKGSLGTLNTPSVASAVAAAPSPQAAVAPSFWDTIGVPKTDVNLNLGQQTYSLSYTTPDGKSAVIFKDLTQTNVQFPNWNNKTDWSDPFALAVLEDLAKSVKSGTYPKLVIDAVNINAMPATLEGLLSDYMAHEGNTLVLDKAGATKLVEAMAGGPLLQPPVNPLKAGQKFSEQFGVDPNALLSMSDESLQSIALGGFGELAEGQYGIPFEWAKDMTQLTIKLDPVEPVEVGLSAIASLMDKATGPLTAEQASLVVNVGSSQYVLGQPLKDILQAAGATQVGVGNSYALTFGKAKHLAESIVNDTPLRPTKLGSAMVNTPPLEPSIHELLTTHHYAQLKNEDPTIWGGILAKPHTTTGPTAAQQGVLTKQVIWSQGSVTANLQLGAPNWAKDALAPYTSLTWQSLGAGGPLPPETWGEVAVAQFHDLSKKIGYSATSIYSNVDQIVLDDLLVATVPEIETIAMAFGGKKGISGAIYLTADQIKAIGKAIEGQIVTAPGGAGTAVAGAVEKKLAGGWTPKGVAEWTMQATKDGLDPNSFYAWVPKGVTGAELKADWSLKLGGSALQWTGLTNANPAMALTADDLTNGAGAILHGLLKQSSAKDITLMVNDSVLKAIDPAIEKLLMDSHGIALPVGLTQWGGETGVALTSQDGKALLAKLDNEIANPLGAVSPPAVPRVGPKVLDYDAATIGPGMLQPPTVKTVGPNTTMSLNWNGPQDIGVSYQQSMGTLALIKSIDVPLTAGYDDNAVAALLGQLLVKSKADGFMMIFEKPILDAHPGLKGTLKEIGFAGGEGQATSMTILPENLQNAIDALVGGAAGPATPSTLLDPLMAGTGITPSMIPGLKAALVGQVDHQLPLVTDTSMAQGFGKLSNGSVETKYRASTTAITVKTSSAYPQFAEQLTTLLKVAEKLDAATTTATVKFEQAWLTKNGLAKELMAGQGATAVGEDLVFDRATFLKLRDAINADLKGLPAPVGSAAPVAGAPALAKVTGGAPNYNVNAVIGKGSGDIDTLYGIDLANQGLAMPGLSTVATEYDTTIASWHIGGGVTFATGQTEYADTAMSFDAILQPGTNPKEAILAMLSALGEDVEGGASYAIFLSDDVLGAAPGLERAIGAYGEKAAMSFADGLFIPTDKANEVILHLYQGVPLEQAVKAAAVIPPVVVTEPLATKLGWDTSKLADMSGVDPITNYVAQGKKRTLVWEDMSVPNSAYHGSGGKPGHLVAQNYHDYAKRYVFEGQAYKGMGTAAQQSAATWKTLIYLEHGQGAQKLFVTKGAYEADPALAKLLDLYGADAEHTFMKFTGRELTPAQAQQMAADLANNAPVTGIAKPSVAAAHPGKVFDPNSGGWIDPAAMPLPPKSAAQVAADYQAELVSTNKIGAKGLAVGNEESLQSQVFGDIDSGVTQYWTPGPTNTPLASMQWTSGGWGKPLQIEDITGTIGSVEVKSAMADAAITADVSGAALLIDDAAIAKLEIDDMGGLVYWSSANDAWTTSQPGKFADYLLGKQKPPVGTALAKPIVVAPPPAPVIAAAITPPPTGLHAVYGFQHADAKALADDLATKVKVTILSDTPLTKTYQSEWANGATVKWAEEQQGDARILRVRAVGGVVAGQNDALVAGLMAEWPAYLGAHPDVQRVLITKAALANKPGLSAMLNDAGWKETKEYFVLGREGVGELSTQLAANKSDWMVQATIPTSVPAHGWSGTLPTKPSPSFIYDYNPATHQQLYGSIVDKDIGPIDLGGGAGQGHELTVGKVKVTWSVSPSGNTIGIGKLTVEPTATNAEKVDNMMAALQHIAEQMAGRSGNLWVKPDLYVHVPGLSQVLKDAGAGEQQFSKLGEAIQMTSAQASVLAKALKTDDMAGLTISISTSSDYLGYNASLASQLFASEPVNMGGGALRFQTGATGAASKGETMIGLSADGKSGVLVDVRADASVTTITMAAQINWFVTHGATDVLISTDVLAKVPKLDKYLVSLGAKVEAGGIRLTDKALYDTRAALVKNALPVPLGGNPSQFAFTITDAMIASQTEVIAAAHSELVATVGAKSVSEYVVGGRKVKVAFARSNGNIFWQAIERGDASIGQARSASVAQLRTFVNNMAQDASLVRLDVGLDVLADQPGLREVLKRYGAKEMAATADHPAFLSLERPHAMKLRLDIEKELGAVTDPNATSTFIGQQAALIQWPVADDLTEVAGAAAKLGGQTEKVVLADKAGNEWVFKPGASGQGAAADKAAAEIAALMGLPVPPVRIYTLEVNGKIVQGSLQKKIPGGHEISPNLSSLTAAQHQALWEHSSLDWVIANDDAHIHNWLVDPDGHIWGIDKTRAWKTFGDPHRDVLDVNSLGQGGKEAMAPTFFKWWKDAKRDPSLLQHVHPTTITKPLRALRAVDDATYRSIVTPLAKIAAAGNSKYKGDWARMVEDMVARKNSAANDLEAFMGKQLTDMKRAGVSLPAEWDSWLRGGGKLNLDATPVDLLKEQMAVHDARFGAISTLQTRLQETKFSKVRSLLHQMFGGGVSGSGYGHYGSELVRKGAGKNIADEWQAIHEWATLHALFDADLSWMPNGKVWAETLRTYFNPDTGKIRIIRSTNRYGASPANTLTGYTADGFRDLLETSIGTHVVVGAHGGVYLYFDAEPAQVFSYYGFGFGAGSGEAEIAMADARIDQVVAIRSQSNPLGGSKYAMDATAIMGYNGPVVSVK